MSTDEKRPMYIANCQVCSLAEAMKDCPLCQFREGLLIKALSEVGKLPVDDKGKILIIG